MICSVWIQKWIQFWIILLVFAVKSSFQHARLMEPPSRASMWRVGFPTPRDVDDNQSYCGGYGVQYGTNGGKCGICGDPWHENPRAHEAPGGLYATGIIGAYLHSLIVKKKIVPIVLSKRYFQVLYYKYIQGPSSSFLRTRKDILI